MLRGDAIVPGALGIDEGRITAVAHDLDGDEVVDYGDLLLMPGAVDIHVHFRDPGHPEKEDFTSGTRAAAAGGVTAVLDMPNTNPATVTLDAFEAKLASVAQKAVVDFGLYAGLTDDPTCLEVIPRATAVKVYLGATTGNLLATDMERVADGVRVAAEHGKTVAFHAEDQCCLDEHAHDSPSPAEWLLHATSRPAACETTSIRKILALPRPKRARLHVTHLSTADGLALVRESGVTCDATPHHLLFTRDDLAERGGLLKMNPPLREARDRDALFHGLIAGHVDCVASDHAPHLLSEKAQGVKHTPAGVPGVETLLPLMLAAVAQRKLMLHRVQEACCETPARLFGLPKGRLEVGYDADVLVVDLDHLDKVEPRRLHSKCGWTPFSSFPAIFPQVVYLRGERIVEGGKVLAAPGTGRFLTGSFRR